MDHWCLLIYYLLLDIWHSLLSFRGRIDKLLAYLMSWILCHLLKKWLPPLKERWVVFTANVEPHVQSLKTKTIEAYEASKTAITPHVIRVKEIVDPYFQVYLLTSLSCLFAMWVCILKHTLICNRKLRSSASPILIRLPLWPSLMLTAYN